MTQTQIPNMAPRKTPPNKSLKASQCKTKPSKRKAELISEYAGGLCGDDGWLKIGLRKNQFALLSEFARRFDLKRRPSANAARILIQAALANLPFIEASWN